MADPEILIFDDDPAVGHMTQDALQAAGYQVQLYCDGTRVVPLVQEIKPRLIVLDIMMPGLDGLSSCKALRALPETKNLRIIVISGKTVGKVDEQALRLGADRFIAKPYAVAEFLAHVQKLIGQPSKAAPAEAEAPIFATVLGSRSSGSTSCVALEIGTMLLVLDAGSGLTRLGRLLEGREALRLVLTHYHEDHVNGLPCLRDLDLPIHVYGPGDAEVSLADVSRKHLFSPSPPKGKVSLYTIGEGAFDLASGVKLTALYVNHAGTTLAVRVDAHGKKIVYCPDNEVRLPQPGRMNDVEDKLKNFSRDADLMIHDARYAPEDHPAHVNEGHSTFGPVVDLVIDSGAKGLLLFHLDSSYGEDRLKGLEDAARAQASGQITSLEVALAREGLRLQI